MKADRLGVTGIFLVSFEIKPHEPRRDQQNLVTEFLNLPRPVVRARASLHRRQAPRQVGQKTQQLAPRDLLAHTGLPYASQP